MPLELLIVISASASKAHRQTFAFVVYGPTFLSPPELRKPAAAVDKPILWGMGFRAFFKGYNTQLGGNIGEHSSVEYEARFCITLMRQRVLVAGSLKNQGTI